MYCICSSRLLFLQTGLKTSLNRTFYVWRMIWGSQMGSENMQIAQHFGRFFLQMKKCRNVGKKAQRDFCIRQQRPLISFQKFKIKFIITPYSVLDCFHLPACLLLEKPVTGNCSTYLHVNKLNCVYRRTEISNDVKQYIARCILFSTVAQPLKVGKYTKDGQLFK